MTRLDGVAVVVPAHDEQDTVIGCLDAIAVARSRLAEVRPAVATVVVVALDACGDATARLVGTRTDVRTVVVHGRCVGAARAAGTATALAELAAHGVAPETVWTAHTDADSLVPPDWLVATVAAADAGADAVLGRVLPDDALDPVVRDAWGALHPVGDGHAFVHGANLAVRASALSAVGGWRAQSTGEDVDLAARLRACPGVTVRSLAAAPVVTSSRLRGRAPAGFGEYLRELTVA